MDKIIVTQLAGLCVDTVERSSVWKPAMMHATSFSGLLNDSHSSSMVSNLVTHAEQNSIVKVGFMRFSCLDSYSQEAR